ncbi:putative pectate lyase 4 [Carex littledalei]|uniref:Pectate lyase n=1 Tax=Carex littledalei TaxID=544730 RepID=A0A833QZJ9_9POAL|nr:putative pectate lyase 4 [Carex littledalei]
MTAQRLYVHVERTLRGLAGQAEGFGQQAIGGLHGDVYHVTTLNDDGPGSLRDGCRKPDPLWIVFDISGTINLLSGLRVSSYKTIDGRGQRIKLTGKGLLLRECEHVIVCNLAIEAGRGHDVDAIQIKPNSKHIWIDRCSLSYFEDGLIDISRGSTDITISRCYFSNHNKTMLIGARSCDIIDRSIRVTVHHCFFDGTRQRHPRVRFGKVHLYNNYTRNWGIYAVCASVESQIVSQSNIYEAGDKKLVFMHLIEQAPDKDVGTCGSVKSEGDLFLNDAKFHTTNAAHDQSVFEVQEYYESCSIEPATPDLVEFLKQSTGWQQIELPPTRTSIDSLEMENTAA